MPATKALSQFTSGAGFPQIRHISLSLATSTKARHNPPAPWFYIGSQVARLASR